MTFDFTKRPLWMEVALAGWTQREASDTSKYPRPSLFLKLIISILMFAIADRFTNFILMNFSL